MLRHAAHHSVTRARTHYITDMQMQSLLILVLIVSSRNNDTLIAKKATHSEEHARSSDFDNKFRRGWGRGKRAERAVSE